MKRLSQFIVLFVYLMPLTYGTRLTAQINTDRMMLMGRNALYYEDYVLAIQRFNMIISAKPWLAEPYYYRALAKYYLEDHQGAEIDCDDAVERNPYMADYFVLRAFCRINRQRYKLAEADYAKALSINPEDHNSWHNMVICQMELKEYERADSALDEMIRKWPKEAKEYTMKAQVAFSRGDSVTAEKWVDQAIEVNAFEGPAWSMKAMMQVSRKEFSKAEESLDKAIMQTPRSAGLYVNRALARYHQDNLRGAMSDYDAALEADPNNYLAHFNRGLLRAQVGEDNQAIEDFDFVLKIEPDNTIALYNRALLYDNIGNYNEAIKDISAVIKDFPEFWEGYRKRAEIRRKIGDSYGAERDEFKILKARMAVSSGTYQSSGKTRKKSEHNIDEYDKLVEEDVQAQENEYASEYRGLVQNRQTELKVEPLYVLTYNRMPSELRLYVPYSKQLDELNTSHKLKETLYLTISEARVQEQDIQQVFDRISQTTSQLEQSPGNEDLLFQRAVDYYHVRDFENCIADLNDLLAHHEQHVLALMLRAQCRYAQLEVSRQTTSASDLRLGYLMVLQDYTRASELQPDMPSLYYNQGFVHVQLSDYNSAIESFTKALAEDEKFPEAYYNRGVVYLITGKTDKGLSDLSQAGEYGIYSAYNLIKKHSIKKK